LWTPFYSRLTTRPGVKNIDGVDFFVVKLKFKEKSSLICELFYLKIDPGAEVNPGIHAY
jgi:hypothetical protein